MDQDWFFNVCVFVEIILELDVLFELCLGLEKEMNCVCIECWGLWMLDIDIFIYEGVMSDVEWLFLLYLCIVECVFVLILFCDYVFEMMIGMESVCDFFIKVDVGGIELVL